MGIFIGIGATAGLVGLTMWATRRGRLIHQRLTALEAEGALWAHEVADGRFVVQQVNGEKTVTRGYLLAVFPHGIRLYPIQGELDTFIGIGADDVRWFGRPQKYTDDGELQEMMIHVERKEHWHTYHLFTTKHDMVRLVREMKGILSADLVTAYRRRRPYVHYGPTDVRTSKQDIYGAWTLSEPYTRYLTPLNIVFLAGKFVVKQMPIGEVQDIRAGRRIDAPEADGLVQFRVGDETFAFSLPDFEAFADALAEAAKRSLEAPPTRKSKDKDDDED